MIPAHAPSDLHDEFLEQVNQGIEQLTFGNTQRPKRGQAHTNRPRIKRILAGYDGSEGSQRAFEWAKDLGSSYGAKVTLVSAFEPPSITDPGAMGNAWYPAYAEAFEEIERSVRRAVEGAADILRDLGVEADSLVVEGSPGREIARAAKEQAADIVIVGATRGGRIHRALVGSTASTLLHRAPCSVLIARGAPRPPRILVATDGSRVSYRAVAHALDRASRTGAELVVQHVLDYPAETPDDIPPEGFVKAVVERIQFPAAPPRVRYVLDVGHPAMRILLRTADEDAGLVVLGSHGKDALERLFVGSTSRRVANESHASVLVVRDV